MNCQCCLLWWPGVTLGWVFSVWESAVCVCAGLQKGAVIEFNGANVCSSPISLLNWVRHWRFFPVCTFWQTLTSPVGLFYSADCWQEHGGNETKRFLAAPHVISILLVTIPDHGAMCTPIKYTPSDWLTDVTCQTGIEYCTTLKVAVTNSVKICSNKPHFDNKRSALSLGL